MKKSSKKSRDSYNKTFIRVIFFLFLSTKASLQGEPEEKFGDYTIKKTNISETCSSFSRAELHYSDSKLHSGMEKSKRYFKFGRDNAERFYEDKNLDHLYDTMNQAAWLASPLWVCLLITLLLAPCVTIYFFCKACKCCFRSCCGNHEDEHLKADDKAEDVKRKKKNVQKREMVDNVLNSPRCKKVVYYCNICLVVLVIIFSIFWAIYGFLAISGMKKADCSVSYFYNDVEEGFNRDGAKWIGIKGLETLMIDLKNEILNLKKTNIGNENLGSQSDSLRNSITSFYRDFNGKMVQDFFNKTEEIEPDVIKNLIEGINPGIKFESDILINSTSHISEFSKIADNVGEDTIKLKEGKIKKSPYISAIESHLSRVKSYFYGMGKVRVLAKRSLDYDNRSIILKSYVWGNLIIFTLGLILFVVASTYSHKLKRHMRKAVTCQAITSIYILLTALSWNSIAILSMIVGSVSINVCGYADRQMDNPVYSKKLISSTLIPLLEACVYKGAGGDISVLLGKDNLHVQGLNHILRGVSVDLKTLNVTGNEAPASFLEYKKLLEDVQSYRKDDFSLSDGSFQAAAARLTSILSCVQNEVKVIKEDCTYTEISKSSDSLDFRNSERYCIVPSLFNHPSIQGRYSQSCASAAVEPYELLKKCIDEHGALLTSMNSDFASITTKAKNIKSSILNIQSEFETLKSLLPKTSKFFSKEGEGYEDIMDCRVIRQIAQDGLGNYCYEFVLNWIRQAIFIIILAPIMTLFGICSFFSVMQVDLKHKRFKKHNNYSRAIVMPEFGNRDENQDPRTQMGGKILGTKEKVKVKGHVEDFGKEGEDGFNFDFENGGGSELPQINKKKKSMARVRVGEDEDDEKSKKTKKEKKSKGKKSKKQFILNKKKKKNIMKFSKKD